MASTTMHAPVQRHAVVLWSGDDDPPHTWAVLAWDETAGQREYILTVQWPGDGQMIRRSGDGDLLLDAEAGTITWAYSTADSAEIPRGAAAIYELKQVTGAGTRAIFGGSVTVRSYLLRPPTGDQDDSEGLLNLLDTADWLVAVPVRQPAGQIIDFSDTLLTIALTPKTGGPSIATLTSEGDGITFIPGAAPYFAITSYVEDRPWRTSKNTTLIGDILRHPDPARPARTEWLGRIEFDVEPGSNSPGVTAPIRNVVLNPVQPYGGRLIRVPLLVGPQGAPGSQGRPGSGGGSSGAVVVARPTPSASWAIPHAFGRLPSVSVYDASGAELIADISATPTMVSVVFAQATAGSAVLT